MVARIPLLRLAYDIFDEKGEIRQTDFMHDKAEVCSFCKFDSICAGLYDLDGAYSSDELYAVFLDPQEVIDRITKKDAN